MKRWLPILFACLLCSCAVDGSKRYPVIGLGWVTVKTNQVSVVSVSAVGLITGNRQFSIGAASSVTVSVPTNANVIIDLRK